MAQIKDRINERVKLGTKDQLKKKAQELNLSLSQYIEMIAHHQIIIVDKNAEQVLNQMIPYVILSRKSMFILFISCSKILKKSKNSGTKFKLKALENRRSRNITYHLFFSKLFLKKFSFDCELFIWPRNAMFSCVMQTDEAKFQSAFRHCGVLQGQCLQRFFIFTNRVEGGIKDVLSSKYSSLV